MSVFQSLEHVPIDLDLIVEVHFMERLHWYLRPATVLLLVRIVLEGEVVLHGSSSVASFFSLTWRYHWYHHPECSEYWYSEKDNEEQPCLQTSAELPSNEGCWDGQGADEDGI